MKLPDVLFRWYPALLLLLLAGMTYWIDQRVQPPPVLRDGSTRHDPDVIVERFSATRMNPDGSQRYAITGAKLLHFPDDDSTLVEAPRFVHFDPKTAPVRVTSREARISKGGDEVDFLGAVHVVRDAYAERAEMTLDTEYLHLVPDRDYARSDRAVTMTQGNTQVRGVGMEFDNRARVLTILSKADVIYASPLSFSSPRR